MSTARAVDVITGTDGFDVRLDDGRRLWVPYDWFPRLAAATPGQRRNWELIGDGVGLHWPEIDEDLSVDGLLRGTVANPMRRSG
jgi:hypothetical protein